jgi:hypothetical protein
MEVWLIIAGIVVGLLLAFAWLPIRIEVDTARAAFIRVVAGNVCYGWVEASEKGWFLRIRFLMFRKQIDLLNRPSAGPDKPRKPSAPEKKKRRKFPSPGRILRTFRLHYLVCRLDTRDFSLNARLYPVCFLLSRAPVYLSVNFAGENYVRLAVSTRLFRLAFAFIRSG